MCILDEYQNTPQVLAVRSFLFDDGPGRWVRHPLGSRKFLVRLILRGKKMCARQRESEEEREGDVIFMSV